MPRANNINVLKCQTDGGAHFDPQRVFPAVSNLIVEPATIKIVLKAINRRGRSRASLHDETVLVASSRQPFLDAARVLFEAGYDADCWLEGWRPEAKAFALRARLGTAARLTVNETRTVFAPWKHFCSSAGSSSIGQSAAPATTPASRRSPIPRPPVRDVDPLNRKTLNSSRTAIGQPDTS